MENDSDYTVYLIFAGVLVCMAFLNSIIINQQPQDNTITTFKVKAFFFYKYKIKFSFDN
jgi:hypothetical protein